MSDRFSKTDEEWRQLLTPQQYHVTREKGTERAFSGEYYRHFQDGVYACVACGNRIFDSRCKYDSGCGWPSFFAPIDENRIDKVVERDRGMISTEVVCTGCRSHLGHVFNDGPKPTGLRYCINSAALRFIPRADSADRIFDD